MSVSEFVEQAKALHQERRIGEAIAACQQAIAADYTDQLGYLQLGIILYVETFITEANRVFEIGCEHVPQSPQLHWARCMTSLPRVYADEAEMEAARAQFTERLMALRDMCFSSTQMLADSVFAVGLLSPFFLAYQGRNDIALHRVHGELTTDIMAANFPQYSTRPKRPWTPTEKIRVGIVCGLMWGHAVWRLPTRGWVESLDRSRFEVFGYYTRLKRDAQTEHAERCFDRFVQRYMSPADWAPLIADDAPHVLIYPELANEQTGIQLASMRLAPVQCTSWGQPITTGMPTIDYYISSDLMEPPDAQTHYTETLVRLPGLGVIVQPDYASWGFELPREDFWAPFDVPPNAVRISCCQGLSKYLPMHDEIFPRIAQQLPMARFLFVAVDQRDAEILARRLDAVFARFGLSSVVHCRFAPVMTAPSFSSMIRDSHIFLDTLVWSGCNTALDALGHGIPIVTLPGDLMRGRHCLAILTIAGVTETIARSLDDYIAITVRLGQDPAWRAEISARTKAGAARVYGDTTPVRALEDFLTDAVAKAGRA
jgi:predicted O-linked N-acetylglucosamine transferase (SPINDLY family)